MSTALLIVTFDNMEQGNTALETLKSWQKDHLIEVSDAVVIVKDEEGQIKVHETEEFTTRRGAVAGGVAGLVIGTMVGGPIGGLILGAVTGGLAGKKIDLGVPQDTLQAVEGSMSNASSAIAVQIKSVKNREMVAAAIRKSGGHLHELSISDEAVMDMEQVLLQGGMRGGQ